MTHRLQIELSGEKVRELDELMRESGVSTKKEFVNSALTLLKWAINQRRAGRIIASIDEKKDSFRELEMPVLSQVKPVE